MSNHLRNIVCYCPACEKEKDILCREQEKVFCQWCGLEMEQHWWKRSTREANQWAEADSVVVFRKADGSYSYPAVNTKRTPEGCERIVMRSLREVERHEREAGVRSEIAHFDCGSGNGHDTHDLPPLPFGAR